jgi:hypothetical protein
MPSASILPQNAWAGAFNSHDVAAGIHDGVETFATDC